MFAHNAAARRLSRAAWHLPSPSETPASVLTHVIGVTAYRLLAALVGSYSTIRRAEGRYQVVRSLERDAHTPDEIARAPMDYLPLLETVDVLCSSVSPSRNGLALLETPLASPSLLYGHLESPCVASRVYSPHWPEALRCGYRSCLMAYAAWTVACEANYTLWLTDNALPDTPSTDAYAAWMALERYWQPRFTAYDAALTQEAQEAQARS